MCAILIWRLFFQPEGARSGPGHLRFYSARRLATKRCCSFFVEDLTPREATGDIVGLSLGTHGGRVGCQVTRGSNQHMRAYRGVAQTCILPEGSFDSLYGMEIAVLPEEQATHQGQEPVSVSPAIEVAGDQFA